VKEVMTAEKLDWRSLVDRGEIRREMELAGTPAFHILDPRGVIRHKWAGAPGEKAIHSAVEKPILEVERDAKKFAELTALGLPVSRRQTQAQVPVIS
jgi:hypothetical protein